MVDASNCFRSYLRSICDCDYYTQWWSHTVLTDMERQQSEPFTFKVYVREVKRSLDQRTDLENSPLLPIAEALHQHIARKKHVLLVGPPGSGKTKALFRYLLELARQARGNPAVRIPILVRLKDYQPPLDGKHSGIVHLIRKEFISLELEEIERYLFLEQKFLLLVDGLNESISPEAQKDLQPFWDSCRKRQVPIVFTTRLLGYQHLEVETQLEIQPILPEERQRFLNERVSPAKRQKLQEWLDRAHQSNYTPFVMWILAEICGTVNSSSQLASFSLGEAFREFVRLYQDKLYEQGRISDEDCEVWALKLKHLASAMLLAEESENFIISRTRAIDILGSEALLNNLIRHHLLVERRDDRKIEFCHQLIQEYYAAEWLLERLDDLTDEQLKYHFLNYLKWTEAIALMFGLLADGTQAVQLVKLAFEIDLMLGARLAGETKSDFHPKTIELLNNYQLENGQKAQDWLKLELLAESKSDAAVPKINHILEEGDQGIVADAAEILGRLGTKAATRALVQALQHKYQNARYGAAEALGMIDSDEAIAGLEVALCDEDLSVACIATDSLVKIGTSKVIPALVKALQYPSKNVTKRAIAGLERIDSPEVIPILQSALKHNHQLVRRKAAKILWKRCGRTAIPSLLEPDVAVIIGELEKDKEEIQQTEAPKHEKPRTEDELIHDFQNREIGIEQEISNLVSRLHCESDAKNRREIAFALGKLRSIESTPELIKILEDELWFHRFDAARFLGILKAEEAVPHLIQAMDDKEYEVRQSVAEALGRIGSEQAVFRLAQALKDENRGVRGYATEALIKIGSEAAFLHLIDAWQNRNISSYDTACRLEEVKSKSSAVALPHLVKMIPTTTWNPVLKAISNIQSCCQFYNYDITQSPPPPAVTEAGVKNQGQVTNYYIGQVGNLNTGNVTINSNQIGHNSDK